MNIAVFDCETLRMSTECDGWSDYIGLGISWICCWISWPHPRMRHFGGDPESLLRLASLLGGSDLAISFNGGGFDLPLLRANGCPIYPSSDGLWHEDRGDREDVPFAHLDLMVEVERVLGHRLGLDALCLYTLGHGKTGHGTMPPQLAREGRWADIADYCEEDVCLTRDLYLFVRDHGYLLWKGGRIPLSVPGGVEAWLPPATRETGEPATERQIGLLRFLWEGRGVPAWTPTPGLTKAQASAMIEGMKAEKTERRA